MAWIKMIPEDEAENELKSWYDKLREPWGGVDNIMRIHSINTPTLKGHYELYSSAMKGSKDLSRKRREMIAVVVSTVNQCHYWIAHHGAGLRKITRDSEFVEKFIKDYKNADLSAQDNSMLDYAVKLTKEPWNMVKADVQSLRDAGFSDTGILDIVQVTGYYAYVNRLADGLGVELESIWDEK
jgi:uncharacterized peroxidase-related enzyme